MSRPGRDVLAGVIALLAIAAWEALGLDRPLSALFGDARGFPWRDAWLASSVLHDGVRWLAGALLALLAFDAARPIVSGPSRAERAWWLGVTVTVLVAVPALKRLSASSCPWSLAQFGGSATYVPHWLPGEVDGGPGRCFPSGHAVAAFAFLAGSFLLRPHRPALARAWLCATLACGVVLAGVQVVRGAHFASHAMWSAWLSWSICVVASRWAPAGAEASAFRGRSDVG